MEGSAGDGPGFIQALSLAGAVYDFADPVTGKGYMFFPIRKLND